MHFAIVLNRDGGTLRTTDLDGYTAFLRSTLEEAGHSCAVAVVHGSGVEDALTTAASAGDADVVMIGGGDGSVSTAAGILRGTDKALAIIPAGTMNLFARSLGVPIGLQTAVTALAGGQIREVDTATANGIPFIHQVSLGMHAKMVRLREQMEFGSRWGKIAASTRASYLTVLNPPVMNVALRIGETEIVTRTPAIGFTNNLFGEGHLPYADKPDGGVLGIYLTVARGKGDVIRYLLNLARGRWRSNQQVEVYETDRVVVRILAPARHREGAIDGELAELGREIEISIEPRSLKVLVPAAAPPSSWLEPLSAMVGAAAGPAKEKAS